MPDFLVSTPFLAAAPLWHQWVVGLLLVGIFFAFTRERIAVELIAMSGFAAVMLLGIIPTERAAAVFGNSGPLIVACMFILSSALRRTGSIELLGSWFERVGGKSPLRMIAALFLIVAPLSAMVNNTPVVVVFLPILIGISRSLNIPASKLLMPLSFAAIVGGTCTLVGTSTNVLAAEIAVANGMAAFGMFEITALGIIYLAVAATYMLTIGYRLTPVRDTLSTLFEPEADREFITFAVIGAGSPLIGQTVTTTRLGRNRRLRIIDIIRRGRRLSRALNQVQFEEGDQLLIKAQLSGVVDLKDDKSLQIAGNDDLGLEQVHTESAVLMEGILGPNSLFVGKTLRELNFRQRYGVLILAVHRGGKNLRDDIENTPLSFGDTLLVEGPAERMRQLFEERDFINLSTTRHESFRLSKAPIAFGAILLFIFGAGLKSFAPFDAWLDHVSLLSLAMGATALVMLARCVEPREAYDSIEWKVIFLIFGMLGVGAAMQESGLALTIAGAVTGIAGPLGPIAVLAAVYLLASLLTEVVSNNAVAVILTPIVITLGHAMGIDPRPFVVAVMFGASASFMTPIGYQTNTLIYGAGGYRFTDFARVGVPLQLLLWLVAIFMIPLLWPLRPL